MFDKMKENMMKDMMGKMTPEERKEMMDKMMESFFSSMSDKEKQDMMKDMMPKMMKNMMGGGPGSPEAPGGSMMGMMGSMMASMMGMGSGAEGKNRGFKPWEMCEKMMSSIGQSSEIASFATPELRGLFNEWVTQIEEEILTFIKENESTNAEQIAEHLKISKESVTFLLSKLEQKGKVKGQFNSAQK